MVRFYYVVMSAMGVLIMALGLFVLNAVWSEQRATNQLLIQHIMENNAHGGKSSK